MKSSASEPGLRSKFIPCLPDVGAIFATGFCRTKLWGPINSVEGRHGINFLLRPGSDAELFMSRT